VKTEDKNSK